MPLDRSMFANKVKRYMTQFLVDEAELADKTGIALQRIQSLLAETSGPNGDEVLILADYFKCDFNFFISNEMHAAFERTEALFRRHDDELTRDDRWAIQEFLYLCECRHFLVSNIDHNVNRKFSFTKKNDYYKGHGIDAADKLRRHLNLNDSAVPENVFDMFGRIGIHVFRRRLEWSGISGLFVRHHTAGLCVLVNYSEDIFRQRFTAAHEVGHAILDDGIEFGVSFDNDKQDFSEIRANAFASRFLVPPRFLQTQLDRSGWSNDKFLDLARTLMVNCEVLAIALYEEKLISERERDELKKLKVPSASKYDPELPAVIAPRSRERKLDMLRRGLSESYVSLCFDAFDRGLITSGRLAEMLLIFESELPDVASLYGRAIAYGD